jgi:membrane protein YdbS with pleckstrin-like domain
MLHLIKEAMAELSARKATSLWRLAAWLCAALTLAQVFIFCVIMARSSIIDASMNYWSLIIGFSITGVTAAVCTSRTIPRSAQSRPR